MISPSFHRIVRRHAPAALAITLGIGLLVGSCGGGGGGEQGAECIRSVTTSTAPENTGYGDGAGPGDSSPGAGDGAGSGAGDGGPGLGRFRNAIVRVEQADGEFGGEAQIDDTRGVVRFVLCGYTGPVHLAVRGKADGSTQYYDESTRTHVAFPADATIHAVVPRFEKNIGITVLTEAAWQYLQSKYGPNGWKTAANVIEANNAIRNEINRFLPQGMQIEDVTRLPELLSDRTANGSIGNNRNGIYGIVNSGLARAAGLLRNGDAAAALKIARQLGADLCDGVIDGKCNGVSVVADSADLAYLVPQFGEFLNTGVGDIAAGCGSNLLETGTLRIVQTKLEPSWGRGGSPAVTDLTPVFLLRNDGRVFYWASRSSTPVPYAPTLRFRQLFPSGPLLGVTEGDARAMRAPLQAGATPQTPATALAPVEVALYQGVTSIAEVDSTFSSRFAQVARFADGRAFVEGSNWNAPNGAFNANPASAGLSDVTRLGVARGSAGAPGYFGVTASGNLFSWGDNAAGQLGLGQTAQQLPTQATPALVRFPGDPKIVSVTGRIFGAFAIDRSGDVWGWGAGGLGEGLIAANAIAPVRVTLFDAHRPIRQIECAAFNGCAALSASGEFFVWGYGNRDTTTGNPIIWPAGVNRVTLPAGRKAVFIGAAGLIVYGLLDDGSLMLLTGLPSAPQIVNPFSLLPRSNDSTCSGPR